MAGRERLSRDGELHFPLGDIEKSAFGTMFW
jgi:hypothetical protein